MKKKLFFFLSFPCCLGLCLGQTPPENSLSPSDRDIGIEFKKNEITPRESHPNGSLLEEDKPYVIFEMPLNDFLLAMAQRAKVNYIPNKSVAGKVSAVFYATDPIIMAKTATKANGYQLLAKDKMFVVRKEEKRPQDFSSFHRKEPSKLSVPKESLGKGMFRAKLNPAAYHSNLRLQSSRSKIVHGEAKKKMKKSDKKLKSVQTKSKVKKELKKKP
ncbi:hypothetical protein EM20IM_00235 [Candidatus Methylacidiphilum infernorum]|uniref:Uncharacterized protein n=1 Tax=Candidatus Methylacidiphilum infernorum TaxID=511746 RepID=A0ABX7PV17_9BACT|nr:hypothetical protein [Candidatus Methylacidiphilum infernorum]QSR86839.1 hypothetical protein EM20IM_00235 [Candidatus Methylacidiphilum infernorum]